jgi:hypothetical protein
VPAGCSSDLAWSHRGRGQARNQCRHGAQVVCRYLAGGAQAQMDKSSRPMLSPRCIEPGVARPIVELRRKLFLEARIASYTGVSKATVSRFLRRAGLSKLTI